MLRAFSTSSAAAVQVTRGLSVAFHKSRVLWGTVSEIYTSTVCGFSGDRHMGQLDADMREVTLSLLILLTGLPALDANDPEDKNSPFYYDWHRLRIGGLICAGVLCTIGIIVLMSGKCKCKFSQKPSHHPGDAPPLITPGSAHNC
ncbi:fxyd domain-containing ion transport regulator 3 [Lynx pardinus]|uniref:FXYD domain-containing ion transport regulator n=2 Tax=Lynx TaxID=13124 RepID=A0A485NRN5_LYNPA|nr:fxyd domain-containing ion transport regulator 3 [Lynx pardinus]